MKAKRELDPAFELAIVCFKPIVVHQSGPDGMDATGPLALQGGLYVASERGEATKVAFAYRLEVGPVEDDRQVIHLSPTPQGDGDRREFLAFECVDTRRP